MGYWLTEFRKADNAGDDARALHCVAQVDAISPMLDALIELNEQDDDETNDGVSSGVLGRDSGHRPESQPA
jgi:hypothetical protein